MKKIICLLLVLLMFVFVGCGEQVDKDKWEDAFEFEGYDSVLIDYELSTKDALYTGKLAICGDKIVDEGEVYYKNNKYSRDYFDAYFVENGKLMTVYSSEEEYIYEEETWFKDFEEAREDLIENWLGEYNFDDFVYNSDKKCYITDNEDYESDLEIHFSGSKVVKVVWGVYDSDNYASIEVRYNTIETIDTRKNQATK